MVVLGVSLLHPSGAELQVGIYSMNLHTGFMAWLHIVASHAMLRVWYKLVGGEAQSQSSTSNTQEVVLTCDVCGKMMAEEVATINVGITCVAPVDAASCKH